MHMLAVVRGTKYYCESLGSSLWEIPNSGKSRLFMIIKISFKKTDLAIILHSYLHKSDSGKVSTHTSLDTHLIVSKTRESQR